MDKNRWRRFVVLTEIRSEDSTRVQRVESLRSAWTELIDSLPDASGASDELKQALRDSRWPLEFCLVITDDVESEAGKSSLVDAQDAVDRIIELAPDAKVEGLQRLLAGFR